MTEDGEESYSPKPKPNPFQDQIYGAGAVRVHATEGNEDVLVSASDSESEAEQSDDATIGTDPTANASFRVSYDGEDTITIKEGFINYSKWSGSAWTMVERKITGAEITSVGLPCHVYLKIPVQNNVSNNNAISPISTNISSQTIDGNSYVVTEQIATDWIGVNETTLDGQPVEASFESRVAYFTTASSTEFRFILADLDADGNVSQKHFGGITIPQGFNARVVALTIV